LPPPCPSPAAKPRERELAKMFSLYDRILREIKKVLYNKIFKNKEKCFSRAQLALLMSGQISLRKE
jgi:hypothetical protein